ncbi:MAG: exo-beta-N-acetylmuramidase NamZ family protein, partial [Ferruginibacter sp.]
VDTLIKRGIKIVKLFGPEHGFRGTADAGEHVTDAKDKATGIPVISLYGDHKKPTAEDLKDVDILIFDIQDVGVRFYTFISSLQYYLEAALENHKPLMILDRPNPNGFYVDGPVLDMKFKSFIGMQAVPIVYGMTIGEYGLMLAGENLLSQKANAINAYNITTKPNADTPFHVTVIKCKNYDHNSKYILPVMPSPNLKSMQSIYLYPSTCFFEGTVLSEGRGTDAPFQIFGHPTLLKNLYAFTPKPNAGAKSSKCFNQLCYGWYIGGSNEEVLKKLNGKIQLSYLLQAYKLFPGKDSFFLKNNFINKLAGNDLLQLQVKTKATEAAIRKSWQPQLNAFKIIRKKYLLYKDFE